MIPREPRMVQKAKHRHVLDGQMFACTVDEVDSALMWEPPSAEQLVDLALEELHGHDRAAIYRVLEQHKPR